MRPVHVAAKKPAVLHIFDQRAVLMLFTASVMRPASLKSAVVWVTRALRGAPAAGLPSGEEANSPRYVVSRFLTETRAPGSRSAPTMVRAPTVRSGPKAARR